MKIDIEKIEKDSGFSLDSAARSKMVKICEALTTGKAAAAIEAAHSGRALARAQFIKLVDSVFETIRLLDEPVYLMDVCSYHNDDPLLFEISGAVARFENVTQPSHRDIIKAACDELENSGRVSVETDGLKMYSIIA